MAILEQIVSVRLKFEPFLFQRIVILCSNFGNEKILSSLYLTLSIKYLCHVEMSDESLVR